MNAQYDKDTARFYSDSASSLAEYYESIPPDPLLPQIIPKGSTLLDIGCGTARDIDYLNTLGVVVIGL